MDEGVAYMVMGEGGEMTPVPPTAQVVAIDNGDGSQQFAIPVMDPETGQETYMIIDPETAQNITNGQQQVMVLDGSDQEMAVVQDPGGQEVAAGGNFMVMLPNGEQGMVVSPEELGQLVQQQADGGVVEPVQVQQDDKQVYMVTGDSENNGLPAIVSSVNGFTAMEKPKYVSSSSHIKIVGIQDKKPTSQISLSKPLQTKTSYTTFQPDKQQQNRAPRKQTLMTDFKKVILSNIQYKIGQNVECICSH